MYKRKSLGREQRVHGSAAATLHSYKISRKVFVRAIVIIILTENSVTTFKIALHS